jgi:hypothetical protein
MSLGSPLGSGTAEGPIVSLLASARALLLADSKAIGSESSFSLDERLPFDSPDSARIARCRGSVIPLLKITPILVGGILAFGLDRGR